MTKNNYHHGELRSALLAAAEETLNLNPNSELSIRALASQLGVSATAPHAHFKSKTDLLAALAVRGFGKLRLATLKSYASKRSPREKIKALAEAYMVFGIENPGLYKLMFTTGLTIEEHPDLFVASRSAYSILQDAIHEIYPGISTTARDKRSLAAWSLVHGMSTLLSEDRIPDDIIDDKSPSALGVLISETLFDH